jgi:succinylglutamate desuccinylase
MRQGERYLDYDLNRLFAGAHQQQPTRGGSLCRLAGTTGRAFFPRHRPRYRLHYDLHTAIRGSVYEKFAIYPFLQQRHTIVAQLAWLRHCGIEAVLLHSKPANTFSYYTSHTIRHMPSRWSWARPARLARTICPVLPASTRPAPIAERYHAAAGRLSAG